MHPDLTTYRRGELVIEVLPGESHSAAWAAVTAPQPRRHVEHARRQHVTHVGGSRRRRARELHRIAA